MNVCSYNKPLITVLRYGYLPNSTSNRETILCKSMSRNIKLRGENSDWSDWSRHHFYDATCCSTLGGYHQNHISASKRKQEQEIFLKKRRHSKNIIIIVNKNKQTKKWLKRYMGHVFLTDY